MSQQDEQAAWEHERHHYELSKQEDEMARAEADIRSLTAELAALREAVAVLRNKLQISTSFLDLEAASHAGRGDQGKGDTCKRQANANREALASTSRFAEEPTK